MYHPTTNGLGYEVTQCSLCFRTPIQPEYYGLKFRVILIAEGY